MKNFIAILATFCLGIGEINAQSSSQWPVKSELPDTFDLGDIAVVSEATTGQALYATGIDLGSTGGSRLYRIDNYETNPVATVIGGTFKSVWDVAIDPTTGRFYGLGADGSFYELNPANGLASLVGSTGEVDVNALEFDAAGQAWTWGGLTGDLFRIDKNTGDATRIGNTGFASGGDLAFDTDGALFGTTDSQLIRINKNTGAGTLVGSLGFSGAFGLEIDAAGTMFVGRGGSSSGLAQLFRVNKTTGSATSIGIISGASSYGLSGIALSASPSSPALFLRNGRFRVEATWQTATASGVGQPVQLTPDTGYFWLFDASNVEFVIKVLNGCGLNNRFWVFAGGLTDVRVDIQVTDTERGVTKIYFNPLGRAFQPLQDTSAFATCP